MSQEILDKLKTAVISGEEEEAAALTKQALDKKIPAPDIVTHGLSAGMKIVGEKFESGEFFLSDMLIAADAFYAGYKVVLPLMEKEQKESKAGVIMGVVAGDIHTIGKDIVIPVMQSEGFRVVDLGIDVPASKFVEKLKETGAKFLFISSFLSETTYVEVPKIVEEIKKAGIRDKVKIFIGGPATTSDYAKKVGADGWGKDAWEAAKLVRRSA